MTPTRVVASWGSVKTTVTGATARSVCVVRSRRDTMQEDAMVDSVMALALKLCDWCKRYCPEWSYYLKERCGCPCHDD